MVSEGLSFPRDLLFAGFLCYLFMQTRYVSQFLQNTGAHPTGLRVHRRKTETGLSLANYAFQRRQVSSFYCDVGVSRDFV